MVGKIRSSSRWGQSVRTPIKPGVLEGEIDNKDARAGSFRPAQMISENGDRKTFKESAPGG